MSNKYYDILGLTPTCSKDDIKKNYKKLALKWHPDRNRDNKDIAEEKFKKISEAYEILSDDDKRQQYDRFGTTDGQGVSFSNANDIFAQMFGQGGGFPFNISNLTRPQNMGAQFMSFNQGMSFNMPGVSQQSTSHSISTNACGRRVIRKETRITNPDGSVQVRIEEQIM
jgi:DnaJ-class molecular chaperone